MPFSSSLAGPCRYWQLLEGLPVQRGCITHPNAPMATQPMVVGRFRVFLAVMHVEEQQLQTHGTPEVRSLIQPIFCRAAVGSCCLKDFHTNGKHLLNDIIS